MAVIFWSDSRSWNSSSSIFEEIMNLIHTVEMSTNLNNALVPYKEYYYLDLNSLTALEIFELLELIKNIDLTKLNDVFIKKIKELLDLIESW
jgi:hypothetical protein